MTHISLDGVDLTDYVIVDETQLFEASDWAQRTASLPQGSITITGTQGTFTPTGARYEFGQHNVLDAIDAAIENVCACGCGTPITAQSESAYFATARCQATWNARNATDPTDVYARTDAAEYPGDIGSARWRPDLTIAAGMRPLDPAPEDADSFLAVLLARYHPTIGVDPDSGVYVLRLDDGSRYVEVTVEPGRVAEWMAADDTASVTDLWKSLERQLSDGRLTGDQSEPVPRGWTLAALAAVFDVPESILHGADPSLARHVERARSNRQRPARRRGASPTFVQVDEVHEWSARAWMNNTVEAGGIREDFWPRRSAPAVPFQYDPQPTVIGDHSSHVADEGWQSALRWRPYWRRLCQACGQVNSVIERMQMPRVILFEPELEPVSSIMEYPERLLCCGSCHEPLPVQMLAQVCNADREGSRARLIAGYDGQQMRISMDYAHNEEAALMVWRELEERLIEQITYRERCSVLPCDERARFGWDVRDQITIAIPAGNWVASRTQIKLCQRHNFELESQMMRDGHLAPRFAR